MWWDNLKEKDMWRIFNEISQIPRESGNEEGIRQYLLKIAKDNGFIAKTDECGNVIIYVEGTQGYENHAPLCFQGHMDMVCVKTDDSNHDFLTDPIEVLYEDGFVKAKDTSLGADNGIAIAMALALSLDPSIKHPPLELLFTISEETGLDGAFNLDESLIKSRRLINLDSEEEGVIYIGCAGGIEVDITSPFEYKELTKKDYTAYTINISNLKGGHSGGEIHTERANAITLLSRILFNLPSIYLVDIKGGTRRNVIPSTSSATFVIKNEFSILVEPTVSRIAGEIKKEFAIQDPNITITLSKVATLPSNVIKKDDTRDFIRSLYICPNGVDKMSLEVEGVVETSNNIAIVEKRDDAFFLIVSVRSLRESSKLNLADRVAATFIKPKTNIVEITDDYPGWLPNKSSLFTKEVGSAYKDYSGVEPIITSIHAGLECGIINSKIEGMDSLSLGPNLFDVHSVNEKIDALSAERIMDFLRYLLPRL